MRIVAALGGNALLRRGEALDAAAQERNVVTAARALASLGEGHDLVVTHGNGPQVGMLALQAAAGPGGDWGFDILGAESEGMIGYLIEGELAPRLPHKRVVSLLTLIEVDPDDPAFNDPTKPIGPVYDAEGRAAIGRERGWTLKPEGKGWRRVVASPAPRRILEISTIRHLVSEGFIVICTGGGGIPVQVMPDGAIRGVEAVIDKDRSSALLAEEIGAAALLLLSDVDGVYEGFGTPQARHLDRLAVSEIEGLGLDPGSMGPKSAAAAGFVRATGGLAVIGALGDAEAMLAGSAGTRIVP